MPSLEKPIDEIDEALSFGTSKVPLSVASAFILTIT